MSKKQRILYTAYDMVPAPKGASTHITYFLRGLVENGYDVTCLTTTDGSLPETEIYEGARMLRIPLTAGQSFTERTRLFAQTIAMLLRQRAYDLIHFRSIWGTSAIAAYRRQAKLLFEVNGLPSIELRYHYPAIRGSDLVRRLREQEEKAVGAADAIICPSAVTKTFLITLGAPADRISVIPNGVDLSLFHSMDETVVLPPHLLYVGTFIEWQGVETMLDALPLVPDQDVRLEMLGKPARGWLKRLQKRIDKLDLSHRVALREPLSYYSMASEIRQASICIAPLAYCDRNVLQGCCPIKILEYMACRRPVVASNLPIVREIVREGVDGLLYDPQDPGGLARCIRDLLAKPGLARSLADTAFKRVASTFTWDIAESHLLEVYRDLLGRE